MDWIIATRHLCLGAMALAVVATLYDLRKLRKKNPQSAEEKNYIILRLWIMFICIILMMDKLVVGFVV